MENKEKNTDKAYNDNRDTNPSQQPINSDARNNNMQAEPAPAVSDETIERANHTGIGDSGQNDEKLTNYTSNHSGDA